MTTKVSADVPDDLAEWLDRQPGAKSAVIREALAEKRERESANREEKLRENLAELEQQQDELAEQREAIREELAELEEQRERAWPAVRDELARLATTAPESREKHAEGVPGVSASVIADIADEIGLHYLDQRGRQPTVTGPTVVEDAEDAGLVGEEGVSQTGEDETLAGHPQTDDNIIDALGGLLPGEEERAHDAFHDRFA